MAPAELAVVDVLSVAHWHVPARAKVRETCEEVLVPTLKEEDVGEAQLWIVPSVLASVVVAEHLHQRWSAVLRELAVEHDADVLAPVFVEEPGKFCAGRDVACAADAAAAEFVPESGIDNDNSVKIVR